MSVKKHKETIKQRFNIYLLTYHIIFVTKFRKKLITNEMEDFMKNHAAYLCGRMDCDMLSAETDEDHIHMLISMPPDVAPVKLINTLKSQLSKEIRIKYREHIEKNFCGKVLFSGAGVIFASQPDPFHLRQ